MRKSFYILLLLFVSALAQAQMNCTFTHYSQENGLSENSVMDMVQDHDGMIWFATWDGINRFNGYDFKVYKARKENDMRWSSNRVDHLQVDKYGDVWCITYDGKAFRFDKRMEAFTEVAANGAEKDLVITSILRWIMELYGCLLIKTEVSEWCLTGKPEHLLRKFICLLLQKKKVLLSRLFF